MGSDMFIVLRFWGTLFLVGAVAYPLTKHLFSSWSGIAKYRDRGWYDGGYMFAKAVGLMLATYIVYVGASLHIVAFTWGAIVGALAVIFLAGLLLQLFLPVEAPQKVRGIPAEKRSIAMTIVLEEVFFFIAFLFWSWVKGHEPSIHGLEKFMDFGFTRSILNSRYFPAPDIWYAGFPINYYYFGHTVLAVLTKLSDISLSYTFNLMLAALFAFTLTMSFSIGYQLLSQTSGLRLRVRVFGGFLTAFLVTLAGNLQTIYAFTKGYTGDNPLPFWNLLWSPSQLGQIGDGLSRYWYANATRFIPFTIHEFPSYSFVVSDVHGHVLSLPFVLLALGLLVHLFGGGYAKDISDDETVESAQTLEWKTLFSYIFYGFLVGVLLMTNALDGPIYLGLFLLIYMTVESRAWRDWVLTGLVVMVSSLVACLPFLFHFKSFVSGLAVNCPPTFLANHKIGPILFEGVEKCQHSPLWMLLLLWGFFLYCGGYFVYKLYKKYKGKHEFMGTKIHQKEMVLLVWFVVSIALIIFPEFFYFKDIYPAHFRSNTMFKLGYQAFIMFSVVSAYTISVVLSHKGSWKKHTLFLVVLAPLLFLVSIYPIFSVRSYFDSLRHYTGLYGLTWFQTQYADDFEGVQWLATNAAGGTENKGSPVIVEADGDSYTDHARVSAFTGLPTIIGWPVHEWLWRGTYDVVAPRREEVRLLYESDDMEVTRQLLARYDVKYVFIGTLERDKFKNLREEKFAQFGDVVFQKGNTTIYHIHI